jgi:hypothetical protein
VQTIPTIALKTLQSKTSLAFTLPTSTKTNTAETIDTTATCSLTCKNVSLIGKKSMIFLPRECADEDDEASVFVVVVVIVHPERNA